MTHIALTAFDRRPGVSYIDGTLRSLFGKDPLVDRVRIVVDGIDAEFLGEWGADPRVQVDLMTPAQFSTRHDRHTWRCAYGTYRALKGTPAGERLILLQDDLVFAPRWYRRLTSIADEIQASIGTEDFVITTYSTCEIAVKSRWFRWAKHAFWGCQAMLFSAESVAPVAREFERVLPTTDLADDMVLHHHLMSRSTPLLVTVPSLVQHVGIPATGLSSYLHTSPSFRDEDESTETLRPPLPEQQLSVSFDEAMAKL
jgi:hypothetical protein